MQFACFVCILAHVLCIFVVFYDVILSKFGNRKISILSRPLVSRQMFQKELGLISTPKFRYFYHFLGFIVGCQSASRLQTSITAHSQMDNTTLQLIQSMKFFSHFIIFSSLLAAIICAVPEDGKNDKYCRLFFVHC